MRRAAAISFLVIACSGCTSESTSSAVTRPDHALALTGVPATWCANEYRMEPDAKGKRTITMVAPDASANVIASSEPVDGGLDTRGYADAQVRLLQDELPGYEQLEFGKSAAFRGGVVREFEWEPEGGTDVWQVQAYRATSGVGYTTTGTTTTDAPERVRDQLRDIVESARFVAPDDATAPRTCDDAGSTELPLDDVDGDAGRA